MGPDELGPRAHTALPCPGVVADGDRVVLQQRGREPLLEMEPGEPARAHLLGVGGPLGPGHDLAADGDRLLQPTGQPQVGDSTAAHHQELARGHGVPVPHGHPSAGLRERPHHCPPPVRVRRRRCGRPDSPEHLHGGATGDDVGRQAPQQRPQLRRTRPDHHGQLVRPQLVGQRPVLSGHGMAEGTGDVPLVAAVDEPARQTAMEFLGPVGILRLELLPQDGAGGLGDHVGELVLVHSPLHQAGGLQIVEQVAGPVPIAEIANHCRCQGRRQREAQQVSE